MLTGSFILKANLNIRIKGIEKYLSLRFATFPMKRDKRTLIKFFLFYKIVIVEISLNAYDENLLIFHIFRLHL